MEPTIQTAGPSEPVQVIPPAPQAPRPQFPFLHNSKFIVGVILLFILIIGAVSYRVFGGSVSIGAPKPVITLAPSVPKKALVMKKFASDAELQEYLISSAGDFGRNIDLIQMNTADVSSGGFDSVRAPSASMGFGNIGLSERSSTNVQVLGIDEPDIVKTNGKEIYLSNIYPDQRPQMPTLDSIGSSYGRPSSDPYTAVIKAIPPSQMSQLTKLNLHGNLLLDGKNLIVLSKDSVLGFNISNPSAPDKIWEIGLADMVTVKTARMLDGKLYLLLSKSLSDFTSCPIPLYKAGSNMTLSCKDIYYPDFKNSSDTLFILSRVDPQTGITQEQVSFVASASRSVAYMSPDNFYITYSNEADMVTILAEFFQSNPDLNFPQPMIDRIRKLSTYDISQSSKLMEMTLVIQQYQASIPKDQRDAMEDKLTARMKEFTTSKVREFTYSYVVKVSNRSFAVSTSMPFPGFPLNQFSLDEYKGNLRLATTSSMSQWSSEGSVNDIYVLNSGLQIIGQATDLGKGERIYSARFIEDKGYLVTFRQTDPFYVLDLSRPEYPAVVGELKIPGYSSYLHPLSHDRILGVGMESGKLKLSLFNVSNPSSPVEVNKLSLDDYGSRVLSDHHAFLQDPRKQIITIPGSRNYYIIGYAGDNLSTVKTVEFSGASRSLYIDHYLYLIGSRQIAVIDENNWSQASTFNF